MKPLVAAAAAALLVAAGSAAHAFDRPPHAGGAPWPRPDRPMGGWGSGGGMGGHVGPLRAAGWGALGGVPVSPYWWGPSQPIVNRVVVNVSIPQSALRLPTAADLPAKPGYVTQPSPEQPTFIVVTAPAPAAQAAAAPISGVSAGGAARIVRAGDGFTTYSATNPRIIVISGE